MSTTATHRVDRAGHAYFANGADGRAHDIAHRALDEGRIAEGYRALAAELALHDGTGCRWTHVHWHMAVFEIGVGELEAARQRLYDRVLPAVACGEAITDGPSLLWRLHLASGGMMALPWETVADAARRHLATRDGGFGVLHDLLALAGAGDQDGIADWYARVGAPGTEAEAVLRTAAEGLYAWAGGDMATAARRLDDVSGRTVVIGGSFAQNQLFEQIADAAAGMARVAA